MFLIGCFVGFLVGFLVFALCSISSSNDRKETEAILKEMAEERVRLYEKIGWK